MSNPDGADLRIVAHVPAGGRPVFEEKDHDIVGFVRHFLLNHITGTVEGRSPEETAELLRQNKISFLFNNEGNFIESGRQSDKRASIGTWSQKSVAP